jgi:hypothetical protein
MTASTSYLIAIDIDWKLYFIILNWHVIILVCAADTIPTLYSARGQLKTGLKPANGKLCLFLQVTPNSLSRS